MLPNLPIVLDGRPVEKITAFLFHKGGNDDPKPLAANAGKSFQGSIVLGMGFTFDDTNPQATALAEMQRLIETDPRNGERIFPYIGGEEVNSSPTHAHHRYAINFGEMSEEEARQWPDLMAIVEEKVKPKRLTDKRASYRKYWWQYAEKRVDLFKAIAHCDRALIIPCGATPHVAFACLPSNYVFANTLNVFPLEQDSAFCILQSRVHEIWARFFGSSMKDDLRYTPSSCFETFPFPENWETAPNLEAIGQTYYEFRADLMVRHNQGLTSTYNRFHDPDERNPDILELRQLHGQMDWAVLDAYGWSDIDTPCGFALDYLDIDDEADLPAEVQERIACGDLFFPTADEAASFDSLVRTGKRKLPWRYRWPEATHDEVLARLLDLNQKHHEEEVLAGQPAEAKRKKKGNKGKKKGNKERAQSDTPMIPGLEV